MARPDLQPVPSDAPVANVDSGVVEGVVKTSTSVEDSSYKTEFVKIYQDAGVIGASMLTLLVLCFLLGMFSLRLLKMYVALTESRDRLDATRTEFSSKMVERVMALENKIGSVVTELRSEHTSHTENLRAILSSQERMNDRLDRYNETNADNRRGFSRETRPSDGAA